MSDNELRSLFHPPASDQPPSLLESFHLQPFDPQTSQDEQILHAGQSADMAEFRAKLDACESDVAKFQLCKEKRIFLLDKHDDSKIEIAAYDKIMSSQCAQYRKRRHGHNGRPRNLSEDYEAEWDRFIGIAEEKSVELSQCMAALRVVGQYWGMDKIKHYGWVHRGFKRCKKLRAAAYQNPSWDDVSMKLPHLQLRRTQLLRGRSIRFEVDPLEPSDLDGLKDWNHTDPFIMASDLEQKSLPFRKLTHAEIPKGHGFDKFGLLVQQQFAVEDPNPSTTATSDYSASRSTEGVAIEPTPGNVHPDATGDEEIELFSPSNSVINAAIDQAIEDLNCDSQPRLPDPSASTKEQQEPGSRPSGNAGPSHGDGEDTAMSEDEADGKQADGERADGERADEERADEEQADEEQADENLADNEQNDEQADNEQTPAGDYPSPSESDTEEEDPTPRRSQRRANQTRYKETATRNSKTRRPKQVPNRSGKSSKTCCPSGTPTELFSVLAGSETHSSVHSRAKVAKGYSHLQPGLCRQHLLAYGQLMSEAVLDREEKGVCLPSNLVHRDDNILMIAPRRRSASMSEIMDVPLQKKRKLNNFDARPFTSNKPTGGEQAMHSHAAVRDNDTPGNLQTSSTDPHQIGPEIPTAPLRTHNRNREPTPQELLEEFLENTHPSVEHITKAFQRAIESAGGLSDLSSNRSINEPMVFPTSECWKDKPTKDQYLTYLLDSFSQSQALIYSCDQPNEPMMDAPIGIVVRQMFQPEPESTCYAINLCHEKANMRLPSTLSAQLDIYREAEVMTTVDITPKFAHADLHFDPGHGLTNPWCIKLWALCKGTEKNRQLYEQNITSTSKFVLLCEELEGLILVLTTEDDGLYIPPGWLHSTLSITGGLTPGLNFNTSQSLKSSAAL